MKSLLVDALRQAKSEQSDRESDDSPVLGETPIEGASNDGDQYVEETSDVPLELMQTTTDLAVADVELEVDDESDVGEGAGPEADAAFVEAFELAGPGRLENGAESPDAEPVRHDRPDGVIEHGGRWLPLVCVLLLTAGMSAIPLLNSLISGEVSLGMTVGGSTMPTGQLPKPDDVDAQPVRFPFVSTPVRTASVTVPAPVEPPPQPVDVVVQVRERSPAGATDLRDDTFSTISALYRAHLTGEVSRAGLAEILDTRVRRRLPGTESELKVLLQRYPGESILHNALGTLLAEESRWPEARAAFARAAEAAEGAR